MSARDGLRQRASLLGASMICAAAVSGCRCDDERPTPGSSAPSVTVSAASSTPPSLLYLPDASSEPLEVAGAGPVAPGAGRCPVDMVDVEGRFCIDRFESSLVDERGRALSPYYHPTPAQTRSSYRLWQKKRLTVGSHGARLIPIPEPPEWQLTEPFRAVARSVEGVVPSGYLSGKAAEQACKAAGKRLCTVDEWKIACGGERQRLYPYGDEYVEGMCNVHSHVHPARRLHDDASMGHLDPRLNQVDDDGRPLLRKTGETTTCVSRWGADGIYDMVGNLDEWVDDPKGRFLGGFYSRDTKRGCDASVSAHAYSYFDYSLGTRCCL